jgi:hypothetical protein
MATVAFNATLQQYRQALARATAHIDLARAIRATWPLKMAKDELEDAQVYLALAKAELERMRHGN